MIVILSYIAELLYLYSKFKNPWNDVLQPIVIKLLFISKYTQYDRQSIFKEQSSLIRTISRVMSLFCLKKNL